MRRVLFGAGLAIAAASCTTTRYEIDALEVRSTLEDRNDSGGLFTPETQSMLRGNHALETIDRLAIRVGSDDSARVTLIGSESGEVVTYENVPLDQRLRHAPPKRSISRDFRQVRGSDPSSQSTFVGANPTTLARMRCRIRRPHGQTRRHVH